MEGGWGIGKASVPAEKTALSSINDQHTAVHVCVLASGYWSSDSASRCESLWADLEDLDRIIKLNNI